MNQISEKIILNIEIIHFNLHPKKIEENVKEVIEFSNIPIEDPNFDRLLLRIIATENKE